MRTPAEQIRAILDGMRKRAALLPSTGGEYRSTEEAMNTGARAKNLAMVSTKKPQVARFTPISYSK